ncbi:MAG: DUF3108 domain-containing protein [Flavobacteriaceae bacterium]
MKKLLFVATAFLLFTSGGFAQAVKAGEKLTYSASYNMSGLMTPLAQVTMETESVSTSKSTLLHLICEANTFSKWDSFFKIRDSYESYVNPSTLKPSLYKREILEGTYTKKEKYIFKNGTLECTINKKNTPERKSAFRIRPGTQDVVTTLYQVRNLDFSKMKPGQTKSFIVVFDEKEMSATVKYMGKETIDAGPLGSKSCYKVSIGANTDKLRGTDKNLIWLTADNKKVPVLIKFSIPVGTGQLSLTNAKGI